MLTSWRSSKFSKDIVPGWFVLFWHLFGGSVAIAAICNPEFTLGWGSPSLQEPLKTVPWAWQCLLSMHCHKQSHAGVPGVAQNHLTWLLISRCLELYIYIYTCFRGLEAALVIVIDIYIYIYILLLSNATILICFGNFTIVTFIYIYVLIRNRLFSMWLLLLFVFREAWCAYEDCLLSIFPWHHRALKVTFHDCEGWV